MVEIKDIPGNPAQVGDSTRARRAAWGIRAAPYANLKFISYWLRKLLFSFHYLGQILVGKLS